LISNCFLGWSDGCFRAYTPETGRLIFLTLGAHTTGVSALAYVRNQKGALISGGKDGQLRSWYDKEFTKSASSSLMRSKISQI